MGNGRSHAGERKLSPTHARGRKVLNPDCLLPPSQPEGKQNRDLRMVRRILRIEVLPICDMQLLERIQHEARPEEYAQQLMQRAMEVELARVSFIP